MAEISIAVRRHLLPVVFGALVVAGCKARPDEGRRATTTRVSAASTSTIPEVPAGTSPDECMRRAAEILAPVAKPDAWVRARGLLACACDGQIAESCTMLGFSHHEDAAPPHDPVLTNDGWRRGCDLGDGWGCTNYGTSLAKGRGAERDPQKAHDMYRRGCDLGDGMACANAGAQLYEGRLGAPEHARAKPLFKRACELGDAPSCEQVQRLHW